MAITDNGIRDTARVLNISLETVINGIKKESCLEWINKTLPDTLKHNEYPF